MSRLWPAGLDGLKTAYVGIGDAPALSEVLAELGPLVRRLGDPFRLHWAEFESAFVCVAAADWDGALQAIQAAIEANRRGGTRISPPGTSRTSAGSRGSAATTMRR